MAAVWRFLILYVTLYAGFGAQSPYLPALLESRDLPPEAIALVLSAATAIRLAAGPLSGRLADRFEAPRAVLVVASAVAALIALGYLPARTLWLLLGVAVCHAAALAPLAPLSDTLALGCAAPARQNGSRSHGFHYGWLRGAGSAAFIVGTMLSGQAIERFGLNAIVWLNAALLAASAAAARFAPILLPTHVVARSATAKTTIGAIGALWRLPLYRYVVIVAALILGSHAMHDSFAVIRWRAVGISPEVIGSLWSCSVAAEVVVFFFIGRPLLDRFGPAHAAMLAAAAGVLRWAVMAETAWVPALVVVEPLHGLTFALLHLTCMRILAESVTGELAATALTIYGTVGIVVPTALLTLASGPLYAHFGANGFWVMAGFCAVALPIARLLHQPTRMRRR